jgi:uncharacterized iron-regulated membrane protein
VKVHSGLQCHLRRRRRRRRKRRRKRRRRRRKAHYDVHNLQPNIVLNNHFNIILKFMPFPKKFSLI